jgi:DMSO/TMAO reductase YedYZ heme-binding membrane subunit
MTPNATLILVLSITLAYSILRYHVLGDIPWAQLPLFVFNKAVSWSGLVLLALAYIRRDKAAARSLGVRGLFLTGIHIVMTMAILSPGYYAKLYDGARLNALGEGALLAGIAAAAALVLPALATMPGMHAELGEPRWLRWQRAGYWTLALTAVHCLLLGAKSWPAPATWPGGLPPITLLAFAAAIAPLLWKLAARRSDPPC